MTNFPTTLDTFINPTGSMTMDDPTAPHDVQHTNLNDSVKALQTKLGINNSTDANSVDYKLGQLIALLLNPNSAVRIKDGQIQIWDTGVSAFRPISCSNGQLGVGAPVS